MRKAGEAFTLIFLFTAIVASGDDARDQMQALNKELVAAKAVFKPKLVTLPEYQEAKKALDARVADVEAAHHSGDSQQIDAAIKNKIAAEKELRKVTATLEASDPTIADVNSRIAQVNAKIDALKRAKANDLERQRQEAQQESETRQERYHAIVDRDPKIEPSAPKQIPLRGDEITLAEPKANPKEFVNRPFIICGLVTVDDYYNFGYESAKATHFSLAIKPITADRQQSRDWGHLYLERSKGQSFIDILNQRDKYWPHTPWIMRVKMTIDPRYTQTFGDASSMYTVLDWQFLGDKDWTPWYSEVIGAEPVKEQPQRKVTRK